MGRVDDHAPATTIAAVHTPIDPHVHRRVCISERPTTGPKRRHPRRRITSPAAHGAGTAVARGLRIAEPARPGGFLNEVCEVCSCYGSPDIRHRRVRRAHADIAERWGGPEHV